MNIITQEIVKELLECDEKGFLFWKERSPKWFQQGKYRSPEGMSRNWNSRYAGKIAFSYINKKGYHEGAIFDKTYPAHRIIWLWMTGEWPEEIDHINGNKSDNSWNNLRSVDRLSNGRNLKLKINNKTGYNGIQKISELKYRATISVLGKNIHLGVSENIDELIKLREEANKKYEFYESHGKK